jgi:hypothetical protein
MSERSFHVYGAVCIGGRWLKIDPSDDIELSQATRHLAVQATPVAFDGCADACLHIEPVHVIADSTVPAVSVDALFSKKRKVPACAIEVMNQYLEYLRRNGLRYRHPAEVEHAFFSWLAVSRPTLHERFAELERQAASAGERVGCGLAQEEGELRDGG